MDNTAPNVPVNSEPVAPVIETPAPVSRPSSRKPFIIIGAIVLILLLVLALLMVLLSPKKNINPSSSTTVIPTKSPLIDLPVTAPKVAFKNFDTKNIIYNPNPQTVSSYTLKDSFSADEMQSLASIFTLSPEAAKSTVPSDYSLFSNTTDPEHMGVLQINKKNGYFNLQTYATIKAPVANTSLSLQALSFVSTLNLKKADGSTATLIDPSLKCTNTFKSHTAPATVTFVECHRVWSELQIPMINPIGMLNVNETLKMKDLAPGKVYTDSPTDDTIYSVNDFTASGTLAPNTLAEKKARPSDFNTVTVGIYDDGRLYSINSTLRWLDTKSSAIPTSSLMNINDALTQFERGNSDFSLTIPTGTGAIDLKKVYPKDITEASLTRVDEMSLVYIDKGYSVSQKTYEPYYFIRGTAELTSGYNTRFVALVNAQKKVSFQAFDQVQPTSQDNLHLGTFKPSITPTTPPGVTIKPTTAPSNPVNCSPHGTTTTLSVPGYDPVTVSFESGYIHTVWYFGQAQSAQSFENAKHVLFKAVSTQYAINVARWLKKHSDKVPSIHSQGDVQNLFTEVNSNPLDPFTSAPNSSAWGNDQGVFNEVALDVSNQVYQAIKDNKLDALAAKENLFNSVALQDFYWILIPQGNVAVGTGRELDPCYISGASPVIFVSSVHPQEISIKPSLNTTFVDPSLTSEHIWNGTVQNSTLTVNGTTRSYLSYEYDTKTVTLSESSNSSVIKLTNLDSFLDTLSNKLGLTSAEKAGLIFEFKKALLSKSFTTQNIKVSTVSSVVLDSKLPLLITPQPSSLTRIHFIISETNSAVSSSISLSPIERRDYTVLELGVTAR